MKISEVEKKIEVNHIDRPEEIYNIFSNIDDHWVRIHRSWIFRGQRSSEWDLLPSLFRIDVAKKWILQKKDEEIDYIDFCRREFEIIGNFVKLSDSVGLKVLTDSYELRTRDIKKGENFPPKQNIEIWAIAQHHGIPTRLLDFSHNGLYATYFAVLDAYVKNDLTGDLAVWAININKYYELFAKSVRKLQVVSVPTHDNNYLFLQKGLFLLENNLSH